MCYLSSTESFCQHEIERATVGVKLELMCFFDRCFTYEWFEIINGTSQPTSRSTNSTLKIADKVTSVMEVGGREYQCRCKGRANCTKFTIWGKLIKHSDYCLGSHSVHTIVLFTLVVCVLQ